VIIDSISTTDTLVKFDL